MNTIEPQSSIAVGEDIPLTEALPPQAESVESPFVTLKQVLSGIKPLDYAWIALICLIAAPIFSTLFQEWNLEHAPQSYSMLIVPACFLLGWMLRSRGVGLPYRQSKFAFALLIGSLVITLLGTMIASMTIGAAGLVGVAAGAVGMRYGAEALRAFWFPLAYGLAIVPLPHETMNKMTFSLQQLSVKIAAMLLRPFGEATVEGTRIHLSSYTLDVIAPCSGMTIILPLLVLTVFYLYIVVAPLWKKAGIFLFAIPVALLTNAVRVALIGVVGESFGPKAAATFHDWSGIITVAAGFAALFYVAKEVKCNQILDEIVF